MNPAHGSFYRPSRSKSKNHSRPSNFPLTLILLTSLFLIFLLACFFIFFYQTRTSLWSGEGRMTLVVIDNDQIGLLSYDPFWDKALWLPLPEDFQISALTLGKYPAASIWKLGEQEKISGGKLLTQSLQWELGIGIDGYIKNSSPYSIIFWNSSHTERLFSQAQSLFQFIFAKKKSNLSLWDTLSLGWQITKLRQDKISTINLETLGIGKRLPQVDDQEIFQVNSELLHSRLSTEFVDSQIEPHPLPVAIINRTNIPGLATKAALVIQSAGGQVTRVATEPSTNENGCILSTPQSYQNTSQVTKLLRWFNCRKETTSQPFLQLTFYTL